jgi:hypothetical protein
VLAISKSLKNLAKKTIIKNFLIENLEIPANMPTKSKKGFGTKAKTNTATPFDLSKRIENILYTRLYLFIFIIFSDE